MIYYPEKYVLDDYANSDAVNQSTLKVLAKGLNLKRVESESEDFLFKEKEHFVIGSLVDTIITCPNLFDSKYIIGEELASKPTEKIMSIVEYVAKYNEQGLKNLSELQNLLSEAIEKHKFQTNWKEETKIQKIITEGQEYFNYILERGPRNIITLEELEKAKAIAMSITENTYTKHLFVDSVEPGEVRDIVYQFPVYFEYDEVYCKGLLDMIIVNHTTKTIHPIDIKTMSGIVFDFSNSVKKRRYDIQAAFYTEGLKRCLTSLSGMLGTPVSDYQVANFYFLVESTTHTGNPVIYKCTDEFLKVGKSGLIVMNELNSNLGRVNIATVTPGFEKGLEVYKGIGGMEQVLSENWGQLPLHYF